MVIVDDAVITGVSAMQAAEAAKLFGARVVYAIAVVDQGARDNFLSVGIPYYALFNELDLS